MKELLLQLEKIRFANHPDPRFSDYRAVAYIRIGPMRARLWVEHVYGEDPRVVKNRSDRGFDITDPKDFAYTCERILEAYERLLDRGAHEALRNIHLDRAQAYQLYINTRRWKDTRERAFKLHGRLCQICRHKPAVHVHHLTYKRVPMSTLKAI